LTLDALLPSFDTSLQARNRSERTREIAMMYSTRLNDWLEEKDTPTEVDQISHRTISMSGRSTLSSPETATSITNPAIIGAATVPKPGRTIARGG
jgi:hypothetical protein